MVWTSPAKVSFIPKNLKMAIMDSRYFFLRNGLNIVYQYHIDPFVIGAHFN
jgi:hypothetical protein